GAKLSHQRVVIFLQRLAGHDDISRGVDPFVEVLARRERASRPGQQQRSAGLILLGVGDGRRQHAMHLQREGVEPLRTVEREDAVALALLNEDRILVHWRASLAPGAFPTSASMLQGGSIDGKQY